MLSECVRTQVMHGPRVDERSPRQRFPMRSISILSFLALTLQSGAASASPPTQGTAAPTRKCELRLSSWCIADGASIITRRLADDGVHDRTWSLEGRFRPESKLFVLEPNGCKTGYADELKLLHLEGGVAWNGRTMNKATVRIKSDGSCDLQILFAPSSGDPMEWALSSGLALIWGCRDQACTPFPMSDIRPLLIDGGVHADRSGGFFRP